MFMGWVYSGLGLVDGSDMTFDGLDGIGSKQMGISAVRSVVSSSSWV